jgi:hypothetical protein
MSKRELQIVGVLGPVNSAIFFDAGQQYEKGEICSGAFKIHP